MAHVVLRVRGVRGGAAGRVHGARRRALLRARLPAPLRRALRLLPAVYRRQGTLYPLNTLICMFNCQRSSYENQILQYTTKHVSFFDLSKAFDSVVHANFLLMLNDYGSY